MPVLRHIIINVIRNKNYDEVIQPNSQELMGQEILNELNKYFQTKTITDIYFGRFCSIVITFNFIIVAGGG